LRGDMSCASILIVEDDEEIREALKTLLELEGYTVVGVSNGREGLDLLPTMERPCLILLDLMMPVMNGWDFLNTKEKDVKLASIPVLIVTAIDDSAKAPAAQRLIKKPIDFSLLLKIVHDYCGLIINKDNNCGGR
jgi:CheY-like chemotaxis protein